MGITIFRVAAVVASGFLGAGGAQAADGAGRFAIDGVGSRPCSDFLKAVQEDDQGVVTAFASWMNGFMSGYNVHAADTFDITPWQTTELLLLKMRAFCEANAELPFFQGVGGLIGVLEGPRATTAQEMVSVRNKGRAVFLYPDTLEAVRLKLKAEGHTVPDQSGTFDSTFGAALQSYQAAAGLPETGLPDQATLNAMFP